jgi:hypothetical protein
MKEANSPVETKPYPPLGDKLRSFDKDFCLLRNVKENIPEVLQIAFRWYQLDDYQSELWMWLQAAMGNEIGAYVKGERRIELLKFYDALLPLLEALNAFHETAKVIEQTGDKSQKSMSETNLTIPPKIAIQEFCSSFSWDYCRMELWDWMDAAISNDDFYNKGLDRSFLLIQYQCIYSMIEAAYLLNSENEEKGLPKNEGETKRENDTSTSIKYFFLNNPLEQAKAMMQEFYSAWVHHTAEGAAPKEHSEKLMFHDYVVQLFDELHKKTRQPHKIKPL